ncbi:NAD(P)H-dependent oxidoreductase [Streptomyces sp. NBC_01808]|uniref:FMN-dependent NADH-azoreductase n=1 Tax=Streptomyces sp. NBC_01808 TaxID=2975947 RepID=UPI002DDBCA62|nr:NAD(P)H-dependent oxidoreductase [Streptomyces sp. NBC_01808]WSA38539.1 NAD(P)H-dependent oxidoreductase [Streptomyces sp. NBC_01808]
MKLFRIDASILPGASASAEIADTVQAAWAQTHPDAPVERRHLGTAPLPADAWALATTAGFTPAPERTPAQLRAMELAAELAAELDRADAVLLAVPLYNYGVSQHFKAWADLVINGAGATTPVLKEKPTVLVTSKGGGYQPGAPRAGWDHSTPYLRRVLVDIWQADLTVIERELTLAASTPGMEALREEAAREHEEALQAARGAGRVLAEAVARV